MCRLRDEQVDPDSGDRRYVGGCRTCADRRLGHWRRGENLTPGEVEAVLEAHPAIAEAAVVGVPSSLGEDDVMAFVALRPGLSASEEELTGFCSARLAPFKVPTRWQVLDRIPRTPTQRIAYERLTRSE